MDNLETTSVQQDAGQTGTVSKYRVLCTPNGNNVGLKRTIEALHLAERRQTRLS